MAQLECKGLTIAFEDRTLYEDLSFAIDAGDYVFILGSNGAGKTTLVKTLLGLRKPQGGEISIDDKLKEKGIGYLPQQKVMQRDFPASVMEVVTSACSGKRAQRREQALNALDRLSVKDLSEKSFMELSGGQQQRVLLARALCAAGGMLLLDEPVAGLDHTTTSEFYSMIKDLNKNDGITILMISHDIEAARRYATHILYISSEPEFMTAKKFFEHMEEINE